MSFDKLCALCLWGNLLYFAVRGILDKNFDENESQTW